MNPKGLLEKLLKSTFSTRLNSLEEKFLFHCDEIDFCNKTVSSIIEDKSIRLLISQNSEKESQTYYTAPNPTRISLGSESMNTKPKDPFKESNKVTLSKEKSMNDLRNKPKNTSLVKSNTKANLSKPKDLGIIKPTTASVNEKKQPDLKSYKSFVKPKTPSNKQQLNKTFHVQTVSKKAPSPEKSFNKSRQDALKKTNDDSKKIAPKHVKTTSHISTHEEKAKTPRKISNLSPKTHPSKFENKSEPEKLTSREKAEYINIQEEYISNAETKESASTRETEPKQIKISLEDQLILSIPIISKYLKVPDLLNMKVNRNMNKLTKKSLISLKKDEMIQNEKNLQALREVGDS